MQPNKFTSKRTRLRKNQLLLLVSEIALPVALVDLVDGLGPTTARSILGIPFCHWSSVMCAIWSLLVLNCGPFLPQGRKS